MSDTKTKAPNRFVKPLLAITLIVSLFYVSVLADDILTSPIIQGNEVFDMVADVAGNKYVVGNFTGTKDFNPGAGEDNKTAISYDTFVTKFNADGSYAWTQIVTGNMYQWGEAVAVANGVVYVTGGFFSCTNMGIGTPGTIQTIGSDDVYVAALNATTGAPVAGFGTNGIQTFQGSGDEKAHGIAVADDVVYVTGHCGSSNAGFGGTGSISTVSGKDAFVIALDATDGSPKSDFGNGGAQFFGSSGNGDTGEDICVASGVVYVVGTFSGTNAGIGSLGTAASVGSTDVFVIALDATDGSAVTDFSTDGIETFGGSAEDCGYGVNVSGGVVYVTGFFCSANAGVGGVGAIATTGSEDAFVLALDATTGAVRTGFSSDGVQVVGGVGNARAWDAAVSGGVLYVTGIANGNAVGIGGAGSISTGGDKAFAMALDATDGSAKTGFGTDGIALITDGNCGKALAPYGTSLWVGGKYRFLEELSLANGSVVLPCGSVTCTIGPAQAVTDGAKWQLTSGPDTAWKNSGATLDDIPIGNYTLRFKTVTGWTTPSDQSVTVTAGGTASKSGTYTVAGSAKWTFMVYLDADCNLEAHGISDFLEMASVANSANVNIVVQMDRISGYDSTYGDWTSCKRFKVTNGMTPTAGNAIADIGEANMGDPNTLKNFINWAAGAYPAEKYALILWNHGGGWRDARDMQTEITRAGKKIKTPIFKAVCWDDTNGGDSLEMSEVRTALDAADVNVNLIGFDACLMAMAEVAYEIRNTGASVMVGSEEIEPGDGWPYNTILADLVANSTWTPAQLGECIVDRYYQSYGNSYTQSAIDLSQITALGTAVNTFANTLRTKWNSDHPAVKTQAQNVMTAIDNAVIHEQHGLTWFASHGLAIYFPKHVTDFSSAYNGSIIQFAANTEWDEFLTNYYSAMGGSWIEDARNVTQQYYEPEHIDLYRFCENLAGGVADDQFEQNDTINTACLITGGEYPQLKCFDDDYYKIKVNGGPLTVKITFNGGTYDLDLELYNVHKIMVAESNGVGSSETVSVPAAQPGGTEDCYYIRVFEYYGDPCDYYTLTVQQYGRVVCHISPAGAISDGAQWRLTRGPNTGWNNSGASIQTYTGDNGILVKDIAGWNSPTVNNNPIIISNLPDNSTTTKTAVYTLHAGSIKCDVQSTTPTYTAQILNQGAQWRLTTGANTKWQNSGGTIHNVLVNGNPYTLTFKNIYGWDSPASQNDVEAVNLALVEKSGTYVKQFGAFACTIDDPVPVGALWRLNKGADTAWHESGYGTANELSICDNPYTLVFASVTGYKKPLDQSIVLQKDQLVFANGAYTPLVPGEDGTSPLAMAGYPRAICVDSSGNRYIAGHFKGTVDFATGIDRYFRTSVGGFDAYVTKLAPDGAHQWTQTFGGKGADFATGVAISPDDGTVYACGYFNSKDAGYGTSGIISTGGVNDAFVLALDAESGALKDWGRDYDGDQISEGVQTFGGTINDCAYGVAALGGNIYVAGKFSGLNAGIGGLGAFVTTGSDDAFVLALAAADGSAVGAFGVNGVQTFGGKGLDVAMGIAAHDDGGNGVLYVAGYFNSKDAGIGGLGPIGTLGAYDAFAIALDATDGSAVGAFGTGGVQTFGGKLGDFAYGVAISPADNTVFAVGDFASKDAGVGALGGMTTSGGRDAFVLGLHMGDGSPDANFGGDGLTTFGGAGIDIAQGVSAMDGKVYVTGYFNSKNAGFDGFGAVGSAGSDDAFVLALDADDGTPDAGFSGDGVQTFGGKLSDRAYAIATFDAGAKKYVHIVGDMLSKDADLGGAGGIAGTISHSSFVLTLDAGSGEGDFGGFYTVDGFVDSAVVQGCVRGLALDGAGNRYITGHFTGTRDFNPGIGSDVKLSSGGTDVFVTRYNADGTYGWTQIFGGKIADYATGIAEAGGVIYVCGYFTSKDADIGGLGGITTSGAGDAFVLALDAADGSAIGGFGTGGVVTFGGKLADTARAMTIAGGVVYVTGDLISKDAGINGVGATASLGANDVFVLALDAADGSAVGAFGTGGVQTFGGKLKDIAYAITHAGGVLYLAGEFSSYDAGTGNLGGIATSGASDAFVLALDAANGQAVTAFGGNGVQTFGGKLADTARAVTVAGGVVYITGDFISKDAGIGYLGCASSTGAADMFVAALNVADGTADAGFGWDGILTFGGKLGDSGRGIMTSGGKVYVSGDFASKDAGVNGPGALATLGGYDAFVLEITTAGVATGVQTFGGKKNDFNYAVAPGSIWIAGEFASDDAGLGGLGTISAKNWNGYLLEIDPASLTAINNAPYVDNQTVATNVNVNLPITLTGGDPDGGPGALAYAIVKAPAKGVIENFNAAAGTLTYAPKLNAIGKDVFTFVANDTERNSRIGTVTVYIHTDGVAAATTETSVVQGCIRALCLDAAGNRYITGYFIGTVDFNHQAGLNVKTAVGAKDAFVTRIDADGTYAWTTTFGGKLDDVGSGIVEDGSGGLFVTGSFKSVDAGLDRPGANRSAGGNDVFILKLDAATGAPDPAFNNDGVVTFGGKADDSGNGIALDATNVYVTGDLISKDAGINGVGATASLGANDVFVLALDAADGSAVGAFGTGGVQTFGGKLKDIAYAITHAGGVLYVAGEFASLDAGTGSLGGVATSGASDAFVLALDAANGQAVTAFGGNGVQTFGGKLADTARAVTVAGGKVYAAGHFTSKDAGVGGLGAITTSGLGDAFVLALETVNGAPVGAFSDDGVAIFGGLKAETGNGIAVLGDYAYLVGEFASTPVATQTGDLFTNGGKDAYVLEVKLSDGALTGKRNFGGKLNDVAYAVAAQAGAVYVAGEGLSIDADLDMLGTINMKGWGGFILKLAPDTEIRTHAPGLACLPIFGPDSAVFDGPFFNDPLGKAFTYDGFGDLAGQTMSVEFSSQSILDTSCLKIDKTYSDTPENDETLWIAKDTTGKTWLFKRVLGGTTVFEAAGPGELVELNMFNYMPERLASGFLAPGDMIAEEIEMGANDEEILALDAFASAGNWCGTQCVRTRRTSGDEPEDSREMYYNEIESVGGMPLRIETEDGTTAGWDRRP